MWVLIQETRINLNNLTNYYPDFEDLTLTVCYADGEEEDFEYKNKGKLSDAVDKLDKKVFLFDSTDTIKLRKDEI